MPEKICIFGGSFDPVHKGHKKLALFVSEKLGLSKMLIIPAAMSPFKTNSGASEDDRLNMCRLAFSEDIFEVSDMEMARGGKSYTVDTVEAVREMYPDEELYLLIGSDQLLSFDKWYRFSDIMKNVTLCAVSRESGKKREELSAFADENLRRYGECVILDFEPFEVSSTQIRKLSASGENIEDLVDKEVFGYILSKGLYKI